MSASGETDFAMIRRAILIQSQFFICERMILTHHTHNAPSTNVRDELGYVRAPLPTGELSHNPRKETDCDIDIGRIRSGRGSRVVSGTMRAFICGASRSKAVIKVGIHSAAVESAIAILKVAMALDGSKLVGAMAASKVDNASHRWPEFRRVASA